MLHKNTKYKQVSRLQLFWDDNIFNKAQYHYSAPFTGVCYSIRMSLPMRFILIKSHYFIFCITSDTSYIILYFFFIQFFIIHYKMN